MQRTFFAWALAAVLGAPLAAAAQPGPDSPGPPPDVRAKIASIDAQAKTAGYAALSPDHRGRVTAIVAKVTSGALGPRDAVAQIDALLTADEAKAVLGIATASRAQMRAAFGAGPGPGGPDGGGGPPNGPPPGNGAGSPPDAGPPPGGGPPPGEGGYHPHRMTTAGGFLLRVSVSPEQMRALRAAARPSP